MKIKIVDKIVVDILPKKSEECPFSEYWITTRIAECKITTRMTGMHSSCKLEHGEECPYLIVKESED